MSEGNGTSDYVFGTANGIFAVDNPNGTILCLKKAATKDFDPTFAGTYKAILLPENRGDKLAREMFGRVLQAWATRPWSSAPMLRSRSRTPAARCSSRQV